MTDPQASASPGLSAEARHVIDSLEAHLNAVVAAVRNQHPILMDDAKQFGREALIALDDWIAHVRGDVVSKLGALPVPTSNTFTPPVDAPPPPKAPVPDAGATLSGGVEGPNGQSSGVGSQIPSAAQTGSESSGSASTPPSEPSGS